MESQINSIDWDMIKAITGIMTFVMATIGALILAATKSIFITKKENAETLATIKTLSDNINNKLYKDGETLFLLRAEYERDMVATKEHYAIEHTKLQLEIEKIKAVLVPRPEWVDSKTGRERRTSENIKIISGEIQKVYESINNMRKENLATNKALNNITGSFKIFLELERKNQK